MPPPDHELNRTLVLNIIRGALMEGKPYISDVLDEIHDGCTRDTDWLAAGLPEMPDSLFSDVSGKGFARASRAERKQHEQELKAILDHLEEADQPPPAALAETDEGENVVLDVSDMADPPPSAEADEGPGHRAVRLLADCLGLDRDCVRILDLCRISDGDGLVRSLWKTFQPLRDNARKVALFLAMPGARARRALETLCEIRLLRIGDSRDPDREDPDDWLPRRVQSLWTAPVADRDELRRRLVGEPQEALLGLDAFGHVEERVEALGVLRGALRRRAAGETAEPGVNILLFGRAGTGKTELARTLAAEAQGQLHSIGELRPGASETMGRRLSGRTDRRIERRNGLRFANAVLARQPNAVLLCDEMEGVVDADRDRQLEVHRLLERNPVPTIFTANRITHLSEAVLRRFMVVVRLRPLGPGVRRTVVTRMLGESGIELRDPGAVTRRLADELECSFGIVASALRAARLVEGQDEELLRSAERIERTISTHIALPRIGAPVPARLPWSAFHHLGDDAEDALAVLRTTLRARESGDPVSVPGVNLLFYGAPGTGKTEFSRTLAAEAGAVLYAVGGAGAGSDTRLTLPRDHALEYAIETLRHEPRAVILFDEMEDFGHLRPKEWLNRLMERSPVPILWTANATDFFRAVRPFSLDRMVHAIRFGRMRLKDRKALFASMFREAGLSDSESAQLGDEFARTAGMTPRQVRLAAEHGQGRGADAIRRMAHQKARLRFGAAPFQRSSPRTYDPAIVRADHDLMELASALRRDPSSGAGLLFSGPSGAGKSAFARYLAESMGKDCQVRRASDLIDKYIGESEKRIARAFDQARSQDAVLVFDEADSLLSDRRTAQRSWEISQVNEMLSQMERHPLPFICTTNLAGALDPASVRRFLIHARFDYLDRERIARGYRLFFGEAAPPEVLLLKRMTPAHLALVRRQARLLRFSEDPDRIAAALRRECRDASRRAVAGFGVARDPQPQNR